MVVRVLVVDRQPLFRRGLEQLLPAASDDHVLVAASTDLAGSAAALVRRHDPDVALVGLDLDPPGALAAISAMRRVRPGLPVLALTTATAGHDAAEALAAGAGGVLVKRQQPEQLAPALLAAADGRNLPRVPAPGTGPRLTGEQQRLWALIARGASTAQIAQALHVSERTVKRLTARLLRTLGVGSRTEAATLAGRTGLLDT